MAEAERLENVNELVNAAAEFKRCASRTAGIDGFLEEYALVSDQDTYDERAQCDRPHDRAQRRRGSSFRASS